ncbi:MAG: family 43 glycosylhydrolase [Prevotella sp.]|nr:family 43 glycosylhydrolase [Prevotella sp.]
MNKRKFFALCCIGLLLAGACTMARAQRYDRIRPGQVWNDTNGRPIQAHSPQIIEQDGVFYWYGENKERTLSGSNVWTWGIRAYRSTDLYNWEDMGLIIEPDTINPLSPLHYAQTLDRPHILYNEKTGKWVCWIKSMDTDGYFVILQADRFAGPYSIVKSLKPEGFGVGDFDMYADPETGKAYVWFERPHWEMICAELTDDYLGTNGHYSEHFVGLRPPYTREAPSHFVHRGRHYMFTSGTTGYVPNPSQVCVFSDPHGQYTDLGCPHIDDRYDDSFGSQIASVVKIPLSNKSENRKSENRKYIYVALADRWLPELTGTDIPVRTVRSYAERYKEHKPFDRDYATPKTKDKTGMKRGKWDTTVGSRYVFLPVVFAADGKPTIVWRDEWRLDDYAVPTRYDVGPQAMTEEIAPIEAPFSMPQLQRPRIQGKKIEVKMAKKGMSTKAIQAAIDKASRHGGGRVVIPAGHWQSGRIELKSGVELHLEEGCQLAFSGDIKDYLPVVFTRDEGIEIYSLGACIYANGAENIAVTGKGKIIGPSTDCEIYQNNKEKAINIETICLNGEMPLADRVFDGKRNQGEVFLPKTIAPINCRNVLIEGVTLEQGLYWNVVPQYCDSVIIRGVTVSSYGHGRTDGIDVESSRNVLIEYCSLDCQDDCYTMKSGRGVDGVRVGRPTENVVVRHCLALRGAGGIVCGTEVAGGVRNVYCHDCVFEGTDQAFRFKTLRPRGGGVEGITVERVRADVLDYAFYCDMLGSLKWGGDLAKRLPKREINKYTPDFNTISIGNVVIENCRKLVHAIGLPERPLRNVLLSGVRGRAKEFMRLRDVASFVMQDIDIATDDTKARIDGCEGVMLLDTRLNGHPAGNISYEGEKSTKTLYSF